MQEEGGGTMMISDIINQGVAITDDDHDADDNDEDFDQSN